METLFIYLLKASALIAAYFLAYHFLLRKETFFNTNRWFLLAGLLTSVIMPLLFIRKVVIVEKPKVALDNLVQYADQANIPAETAIDWSQLTLIGYSLIAIVLFFRIVTHLISLFKLLYKKDVIKREQFSLVDLNEDIAPFSFFNYIVFNSSFYTNDELHSILLHEKIHSREKHSIDILLAKFFCILFWFNPFMWLYKKAIAQNLEYIADQKAIRHIDDKKVYQKALLKVVSHQNCLTITNHFYQSLIKKRIVMLNKNQSSKTNSWKYLAVLPLLALFMLQFQVKVLAQEKAADRAENRRENKDVVSVVIDKNSTNEEIEQDSKRLKNDYGITLKVSKIKRNSNGEITGIKVTYKDKNGNTGTSQTESDSPIEPIHFYKETNRNGKGAIGFGTSKARHGRNGLAEIRNEHDIEVIVGDEDDYDFNWEAPEVPEVPEAAEMPEMPEMPELPEGTLAPVPPVAPHAPRIARKSVVVKQDGNKKEVWVNGEKIAEDVLGDMDFEDADRVFVYNTKGPKGSKGSKGPKGSKNIVITGDVMQTIDDEDGKIIIVTKDRNGRRTENIERINIRRQAMEEAREEVERARPAIERARKEAEEARKEVERERPAIERARKEAQEARKEVERARPAIERARKEAQEARKEVERARPSIERARKEDQQAREEGRKAREEAEKEKRNN